MSKRKPFNNCAGYVASKINPFTNSHNVIYIASDAGIDAEHKYVIVCEGHTQMISTTSVPKARVCMKNASEWCSECVAMMPAEEVVEQEAKETVIPRFPEPYSIEKFRYDDITLYYPLKHGQRMFKRNARIAEYKRLSVAVKFLAEFGVEPIAEQQAQEPEQEVSPELIEPPCDTPTTQAQLSNALPVPYFFSVNLGAHKFILDQQGACLVSNDEPGLLIGLDNEEVYRLYTTLQLLYSGNPPPVLPASPQQPLPLPPIAETA